MKEGGPLFLDIIDPPVVEGVLGDPKITFMNLLHQVRFVVLVETAHCGDLQTSFSGGSVNIVRHCLPVSFTIRSTLMRSLTVVHQTTIL